MLCYLLSVKKLLAQIKNEFLVEYRSMAQTGAFLLFIWSICYVIYRIREGFSAQEFNFLFWVIFMLAAMNIALKGANHSSIAERYFLYSLVPPHDILVARLVFNAVYLFLMGVVLYLSLFILFSPSIEIIPSYFLIILVAAIGCSSVLSFVGVVSRQIEGQNTALAILSIPLIIPVIILVNEMGGQMLVNNPVSITQYIGVIGISLLSISLSLILFPFIWKE